MATRETMYEEINMSLNSFGDALLDDGFLPDYATEHFLLSVAKSNPEKAKEYSAKSKKTMPVVNALYNIYVGRATEHDLRILREQMVRQVDYYVDCVATDEDES